MDTKNKKQKRVISQEELEALELSPEELDQVGGGITDQWGRWMTIIWFGCGKWEEKTYEKWEAAKGQCGSCRHWINTGRRMTVLRPCAVNVEPK